MKKITILLIETVLLMLLPIKAWSQEAYAWLSSNGSTFTFCYDENRTTREGITFSLDEDWSSQTTTVACIVFNPEFADVRPTSTNSWFKDMSLVSEIPTLDYLTTSDVTDMSYMFYGCSGLTSLELSFDTRNVTSMNYMFYGCSALTNLTIWSFETDHVLFMESMFEGCSGLTQLDTSSFNTTRVKTMKNMFCGCSSLTELDLGNFNTSSVESFERMFFACGELEFINVTSFNTSRANNMSYMFYGCNRLPELDLSNFQTSGNNDTKKMLGCQNLHTLIISSRMSELYDNACEGVGSPSSPCIIFSSDDFDFGGVDTSGSYFEWKSGFFKFDRVEITISNVGMATFCYDKSLDFSGVTDYKAYIACHYDPETNKVTLMRVENVPPCTGIIVKGTPGTYNVPEGESRSQVGNLLFGTIEETFIIPNDDDHTNFILASKDGKVGFYRFTEAFFLDANKAYLQLENSILGNDSNGMRFDFEDETTDIDGVDNKMQQDVVWYTIDGRRLEANPTQKGLYITSGRKIVVK